MATTTVHALRYPTQITPGTGPDVPLDIKKLADDVDSKLTPYTQGLLADLPAFGKAGRNYLATDNGHLYLDIGTEWIDRGVALAAGVVGNTELADNSVTLAKMADNSVGAAEIIAGAVGETELADGSVTGVKIASALKPSGGAAAASEALRALGTGAGTAAAGNDSRLSDQRTPSDASVTLAKLATAVLNALCPIGGIIDYAGSSAPSSSWLICDGSAVSRSTYASLFATIGTTYGAGNGTTTFNLPPKGVFYVGRDSGQTEFDTLGETGGAKTHTHGDGSLAVASHSHDDGSLSVDSHAHGAGSLATPDHLHAVNGTTGAESLGSATILYAGGGNNFTFARGPHTHSVDIWSGAADRSLAVGGSTAGATAGVSGSTGSSSPDVTGSTASSSGLPPYSVVNKLIRVA
jgi:microcystin-dependent protein